MSPSPEGARAGLLGRHRRILGEGGWVIVGQAAMAVGLLAGTRILTELMPPAAFGSLSLLLGLWTLSRLIFVVSVGNALLRFHSQAAIRGEVPVLRLAGSALLKRALLIPAAALVAGGAIYSVATGEPYVPFLLLAAYLIVEACKAYEVNYLVAARRQKEAALIDGAEALLRPALVVPAILLLGPSARTVLLVAVLVNLLMLGAMRLFLRRDGVVVAPEPQEKVAEMGSELRRYAYPLMPKAAVLWISNLSDRYIIRAFRGPDQVGIYAAIYGLMSQPFLLGHEVIARTLIPSYFHAVANQNEKAERRIFRVMLGATFLLCAAGVLAVAIFHRQIGTLVLGERYRSSSWLMTPLALGNAIYALENVFERHLFAHKRTTAIFRIQVLGAVAALATTVPLVYVYGAWGAAIACPLYYSLQLGYAAWTTRN